MYEEYESFIQDGISRGIFLDKAGNLSSVGVSIYYKIRKIIAESKDTPLREIIPSTMGEPLLYKEFDEISTRL